MNIDRSSVATVNLSRRLKPSEKVERKVDILHQERNKVYLVAVSLIKLSAVKWQLGLYCSPLTGLSRPQSLSALLLFVVESLLLPIMG